MDPQFMINALRLVGSSTGKHHRCLEFVEDFPCSQWFFGNCQERGAVTSDYLALMRSLESRCAEDLVSMELSWGYPQEQVLLLEAIQHNKKNKFLWIIEGSLEVKLPTIWTDEKQSREDAERRERLEERRVEEKESEERRYRCAKR